MLLKVRWVLPGTDVANPRVPPNRDLPLGYPRGHITSTHPPRHFFAHTPLSLLGKLTEGYEHYTGVFRTG